MHACGVVACAVVPDVEFVLSPDKLGRYRLIRRLASGGMGEVYLGQIDGAANFSKQFAIKRILPHLSDQTDFVHKFIDEANVMVQLHHGNIVPVVELNTDGNELYLVMEYLPGRDLKTLIRTCRSERVELPIELALWLVKEILMGLDYAHRKHDAKGQPLNIVHRDVSPANIMLGAGGAVKLIDFGIAQARGRLQQSASGTLQGKFVYMSPEQAEGRHAGPKSDIFSAGLILYELICQVRPFDGSSETETLRLVRECRIKSPTDFLPDLPVPVSELLMKSLARDPELRFTSAEVMAQAIQRYLALNDSSAGPAQLTEFLESVFPDGVIPSESPQPKSVDDALLHQLDAFTPSVARLNHTQTRTGPAGERFSHVRLDTASQVAEAGRIQNTGSSSLDLSEPATKESTKVKGRKRMLFLGLTLGIIGTVGVLIGNDSPKTRPISFAITPSSISGLETRVDGIPNTEDDAFRIGRVYSVCARAPGYQERCERFKLTSDDNVVALNLLSLPQLTPMISPNNVSHRVLVDRVVTDAWPLTLQPRREYIVCVEAPQHTVVPNCRRIVADKPILKPTFKIEQKVEPVEAETTPVTRAKNQPQVPKSKSKGDALAERRKNPKRVSAAPLVIRSIPTATVWRNGREVGATPYQAPILNRTQLYTLRAKGYADTDYRVLAQSKPGTVTVELKRPGYFTLRVKPSASSIYIDGKRVGRGVVIRHALRGGKHKLEIKYEKDGTVLAKQGPIMFSLKAGQHLRHPPLELDLSPNPPGQLQ